MSVQEFEIRYERAYNVYKERVDTRMAPNQALWIATMTLGSILCEILQELKAINRREQAAALEPDRQVIYERITTYGPYDEP